MSAYLKPIARGQTYDLYAIADGERCNLIKELKDFKKRNREAHGRLLAVIAVVAKRGTDDLPENKYGKLRDDCFELKDYASKCRIYGFIDPFDPKKMILTHQRIKGNRREQDDQINALCLQRARYRPLPIETIDGDVDK